MANSQADFAKEATVEDIAFSAAGTVTNDCRVVIAEGTTKEEAVLMLTRAIESIIRGVTTLQ